MPPLVSLDTAMVLLDRIYDEHPTLGLLVREAMRCLDEPARDDAPHSDVRLAPRLDAALGRRDSLGLLNTLRCAMRVARHQDTLKARARSIAPPSLAPSTESL